MEIKLTVFSMMEAFWNCMLVLSIFVFKFGDGFAYFGCK